MHDAMADAEQRPAGQQLATESQDLSRPAAVVELVLAPAPLSHRGPCRALGFEMRIDADALNLSAEQQQAVATRLIEREFDARGAGIEDGDGTLCSGHGAIL